MAKAEIFIWLSFKNIIYPINKENFKIQKANYFFPQSTTTVNNAQILVSFIWNDLV